MNKAVELVTEWGKFDARHPDGTLEDFCRHYLLHKADTENTSWQSAKWPAPVTVDFALLRLTGRVVKLHSIYAAIAMQDTGINTLDEFSLLNVIQNLGEPRKTEVIYMALFELSTGTDMLNRLKKVGYISEHDDPDDKRSKRLKITPAGSKALTRCRKQIEQLAEMEFHDLSVDEKKICIQLLSRIDEKFSKMWISHKGRSFDDIYKEVTGTSWDH